MSNSSTEHATGSASVNIYRVFDDNGRMTSEEDRESSGIPITKVAKNQSYDVRSYRCRRAIWRSAFFSS